MMHVVCGIRSGSLLNQEDRIDVMEKSEKYEGK